MRIRLADRVQENYAWDAPAKLRSPIEIMGSIYPGMFGSGLSDTAGTIARDSEPHVVDLGIGSYLRTDPEIARAVTAALQGRNLHYLRRPEVIQLVAQKYRDEQEIALDPHTQIFLTAGA